MDIGKEEVNEGGVGDGEEKRWWVDGVVMVGLMVMCEILGE